MMAHGGLCREAIRIDLRVVEPSVSMDDYVLVRQV